MSTNGDPPKNRRLEVDRLFYRIPATDSFLFSLFLFFTSLYL